MRVTNETTIVIALTVDEAGRLSSELGTILAGTDNFYPSLSSLEDGIDEALDLVQR